MFRRSGSVQSVVISARRRAPRSFLCYTQNQRPMTPPLHDAHDHSRPWSHLSYRSPSLNLVKSRANSSTKPPISSTTCGQTRTDSLVNPSEISRPPVVDIVTMGGVSHRKVDHSNTISASRHKPQPLGVRHCAEAQVTIHPLKHITYYLVQQGQAPV